MYAIATNDLGFESKNGSAVSPDLTLADRLKVATREGHDHIESASDFITSLTVDLAANKRGLSAEKLDKARKKYPFVYEAYLVASYGFEVAVLNQLRRYPAETLGLGGVPYPIEQHDIPELIRADLAKLGSTWALPELTTLPAENDLPTLLGMEYVRRGSRNGNIMIARFVRANLQIGKDDGAAFLNTDGPLVKQRFLEFKHWLNSFKLTCEEVGIVVASATRTFLVLTTFHQEIDRQMRDRYSQM